VIGRERIKFTRRETKEKTSCKKGKQRRIPLKFRKIPAQANGRKKVFGELIHFIKTSFALRIVAKHCPLDIALNVLPRLTSL
jgi:hypothetical protein